MLSELTVHVIFIINHELVVHVPVATCNIHDVYMLHVACMLFRLVVKCVYLYMYSKYTMLEVQFYLYNLYPQSQAPFMPFMVGAISVD